MNFKRYENLIRGHSKFKELFSDCVIYLFYGNNWYFLSIEGAGFEITETAKEKILYLAYLYCSNVENIWIENKVISLSIYPFPMLMFHDRIIQVLVDGVLREKIEDEDEDFLLNKSIDWDRYGMS